jgi:hypothetical protein
MIGYTGNKMLITGNFKEYIKDIQRILDIINEKKELFVVILKGCIPEKRNDKSKTKQKKAEETHSAHDHNGVIHVIQYLWYLIDHFGFVIDNVAETFVFYTNENRLFTKFTIQLM